MCSVRDEEPGVLQSILRCGVPGVARMPPEQMRI